MHILTIKYDPESQFCPLSFSYNVRFLSFLKTGIKPISYRKYDQQTKTWSVHVSKLPTIVSFGKRFFAHVDYSALPEAIQIQLVENLQFNNCQDDLGPRPSLASPLRTPHQVLHLLPTAPPEVVKAAYRALVSIYHPDHGGTSEDFIAIQKAYNKIIGKN